MTMLPYRSLTPITLILFFHEAAISDTTVLDQAIVVKTNVNAFKSILALAKRSDATVVYASSAATLWRCTQPTTCRF